jgi:hypothetical protein
MVIAVPVQPRERVVKNVPGAGRKKDTGYIKNRFFGSGEMLEKN